jgi:carboxymethylenebutenolidase
LGLRIRLTAEDGFEFNAYVARPDDGEPQAGVVVCQEVWGTNRWIRSVVDRYARHGYYAVAPALTDRMEMGYESEDYGPTGFQKVGELMKRLDLAKVMLDIKAAAIEAGTAGKVGITGFCFGGANSWRAAHEGLGLSAASGYYGGGVPNYIDLAPTIPIEMHFGGADTGIPLEQIEALRVRYPEVPIYVYDGAAHGFCNSDRPDHFDEAACTKASARTLSFFRQHLG